MSIIVLSTGKMSFEKAVKKAKVVGKGGKGWDDAYIKNAHAGHVTIFFIDGNNKAEALDKINQSKPYAKNINNVYYFGKESENAIKQAIELTSPNFVRKEGVERKMKKSDLRQIIKEEIQKLFEEAPPPGFVAKRAKTICKKVSQKLGDATDFYVAGKIHDDYLRDEISSINFGSDIESEINVFRKSGYSDEEITGVYAELKQAKGKTVDLPKPISLTFTVFKRK